MYLATFILQRLSIKLALISGAHWEMSQKFVPLLFSSTRGELFQRYREGQEDQLSALGLVVNMIVLWNTLYMDAVLAQLRSEGYPVRPEDEARLSPFGHEHINMLGRYSFSVPEAVARGELRPLGKVSED